MPQVLGRLLARVEGGELVNDGVPLARMLDQPDNLAVGRVWRDARQVPVHGGTIGTAGRVRLENPAYRARESPARERVAALLRRIEWRRRGTAARCRARPPGLPRTPSGNLVGVARERKTVETLPKTLPGAVCEQWVRCFRPGCRCARGRPHGPYFYRFWREACRLRKQYVRRGDVEQVRARCQGRRQDRQELAEWRDVWRQMAALLREVERR